MMTGKEALIALANGEDVEVRFKSVPDAGWYNVGTTKIQSIQKILEGGDEFRLKPRTISINGIEVPAPFEPKAGEQAFYITAFGNYDSLVFDWQLNDFGYWRNEEEIKQVVAALRSIFK